MFKSRSVAVHFVRGIAGFGFLSIALQYGPVLGWWTLAPAAAALVCFRGCPMCWTFGLIETMLDCKPGAICVDGSCSNVRAGSEIQIGSISSLPSSQSPSEMGEGPELSRSGFWEVTDRLDVQSVMRNDASRRPACPVR
jgi:hypothetical protein